MEISISKMGTRLHELSSQNRYVSKPVSERLERAFLALDADLSEEAITSSQVTLQSADGKSPTADEVKAYRDIRMKTLSVALSGAVATLAHIEGADLHIAGAGDVGAVMGSLSENETWVAKRLTVEHNSDNMDEVSSKAVHQFYFWCVSNQ